jgi:hypothetical protein
MAASSDLQLSTRIVPPVQSATNQARSRPGCLKTFNPESMIVFPHWQWMTQEHENREDREWLELCAADDDKR